MKVVCHAEQKRHYPEQFIVNGVFRTNPELPERFDRLLEAALAAGCEQVFRLLKVAGQEPDPATTPW